jgi:hypothetical protein
LDSQEIPKNVKAFIASHIDSVVHLEILLLFSREPEKFWSAEEVGKELRISPAWAESELALLSSRGVLKVEQSNSRMYRHGAISQDLDCALADLATAYRERRVSVINLIFAKPADKLRDFADAFRLRKDKDDA